MNYVEWESAEHLNAARDDRYVELVTAVLAAGFTATHAPYEIVHQRDADSSSPVGASGAAPSR